MNHIIPLTVNINSDSSQTTPIVAAQTGPGGAKSSGASSSPVEPTTTRVVSDMHTIYTAPSFGIGQRAILLLTPHGTVMWDLIGYLDDATISRLKAPPFNGLRAIVISHPHYYTNHLDWAETFDCPVYIAAEDEVWTSREDVHGRRKLITGATEEIVPGVTAIKVGGHFPGSLVLHWKNMLLIADSIVTQPSALYHINRPAGTISYTYMWSIPNMIPLSPRALVTMWQALQPFEFTQTHGAILGQDVYDPNVKNRILESMRIQSKSVLGENGNDTLDQLV
jgi:glyoxylase-like metal-dependent hydrolase (beta-lactamase superfamily II)